MATVHVFLSTGRFRSFREIWSFIDEATTKGGKKIPSAFMEEVGLGDFEPGCIEAIPSKSGKPISVAELLANASYADEWLSKVDASRTADAAICVFAPNVVRTPKKTSLEYLGGFPYSE